MAGAPIENAFKVGALDAKAKIQRAIEDGGKDAARRMRDAMNPQRRLADQAALRAGGGIGNWRAGIPQFGGGGQLGLGGGIGGWRSGMASRARQGVMRQAQQTTVTQNTELTSNVTVQGITDPDKLGAKMVPVLDKLLKQRTGLGLEEAIREIKRIQASQGATA